MLAHKIRRGGRKSLYDVLTQLGLTTNLKLCLDAGKGASFTSGQKWLDLSGGGYDFFLGTTSGADASDPTFNGTADNLSSAENFSADGGDYFTYDAANESWMNNIHKDSAAFTFCCWFYNSVSGVARGIAGTDAGNTAKIGFDIFITAAINSIRFRCNNGSGVIALDFNPGTPCVLNNTAWNFLAISVSETDGVTGAKAVVNGNTEEASGTYSSPSAAAATHTLQFLAEGGNALPVSNGDKIAQVAMWEGTALSLAQLDSIYQATRGRYGV